MADEKLVHIDAEIHRLKMEIVAAQERIEEMKALRQERLFEVERMNLVRAAKKIKNNLPGN